MTPWKPALPLGTPAEPNDAVSTHPGRARRHTVHVAEQNESLALRHRVAVVAGIVALLGTLVWRRHTPAG